MNMHFYITFRLIEIFFGSILPFCNNPLRFRNKVTGFVTRILRLLTSCFMFAKVNFDVVKPNY